MTVRDYMEPALRARIGTFNPGAARVLRRSGLPRPPGHADARLSLVRPGADGEGAAPEPDPARAAALQHLHHAHRGTRHRLGRDDAAGGDVRRAAALARADLRPARRSARRARSATSQMHANELDARSRRRGSRRRTRRAAGCGSTPTPFAASSISICSSRLRHQLRHRQDPDRGHARRAEAPARRRVHDASGSWTSSTPPA